MFKAKNGKGAGREDGAFGSGRVKHDPNAESARAVFGLKEPPRAEEDEKWPRPE